MHRSPEGTHILSIDLNCDMGEGMPYDTDLMPFISSVNIACGGHAGDANTMRHTVELALRHKVAIGAHPSFPDKANFGRNDLMDGSLRPEELVEIIWEQVDKLKSICEQSGAQLHHIKPHGALYNRAARDGRVSSSVCTALLEIDPTLFLYGLSGSEMKTEADAFHIKFVSEVFADRTYQEDGRLTPRTQPHALIENEDQALYQVLQMVKKGQVIALSGESISLNAETICVHGDGKKAVDFARMINNFLIKENIRIAPP